MSRAANTPIEHSCEIVTIDLASVDPHCLACDDPVELTMMAEVFGMRLNGRNAHFALCCECALQLDTLPHALQLGRLDALRAKYLAGREARTI
jgi:hypothetical protein